jgi:hypothetical protein
MQKKLNPPKWVKWSEIHWLNTNAAVFQYPEKRIESRVVGLVERSRANESNNWMYDYENWVREIRNKSSHTLVRLWRNESEKKMKYTVSKSNLNVMMGGRPRRPHSTAQQRGNCRESRILYFFHLWFIKFITCFFFSFI